MLPDRSGSPAWEPGRFETAAPPDRCAAATGLVLVRGGGGPPAPRRLPHRSPASLGRRERHALELTAAWAPKELAVFTAVAEGWLVRNAGGLPMRVESDWIRSGDSLFAPGAMVMLQRGDHRLGWLGAGGELSVSVSVRARRPDDGRIPYAVDSVVDPGAVSVGSYLGVPDAAMSASLRYRMAVLFRHLLEDEPRPERLLAVRADYLGMSEGDLEWSAHRLRRRVNAVLGRELQTLEELGSFLVREAGAVGPADLEP